MEFLVTTDSDCFGPGNTGTASLLPSTWSGPNASNNLLQRQLMRNSNTFANRVPGQPLFTVDPNTYFDPNSTFILNPKAWVDPAPGQFSSSAAYYNDYRQRRIPSDNMSLGRIFRIGEKASLNIRIEFAKVFNRTQTSNPMSTNAGATQVRNAATGRTVAGFGYVNPARVATGPRTGRLVARIQFRFQKD